MRKLKYALLLATLALAVCAALSAVPNDPQSISQSQAAAVETGVRTFVQTIAHDVTQDGPSAWRKHLEDSPAFFMAVDGKLAFPNSAAATAGILAFAPTIKKIELHWGDDLRVDPLTPHLAVVAATYHEIWESTNGQHVDVTGFFTGTAEFHDGRWQFRNAHWSDPVPPPQLPTP
jgi:hypothetical protein